jgi:hypothetical protein
VDTTHPGDRAASIVVANYAKTMLVRGRIVDGGPGAGQFRLVQLVVVPPLAMRTMEATVLNRFGFRQTDLIADRTIHKNAATFNFYEENLAGKMKAR